MAARPGFHNDQASAMDLPGGGCNFKDLSRDQAPSCPCRRFYLDQSRLEPGTKATESTWCFCGHHACFHDHSQHATGTGTQATQRFSQLTHASRIATRSSISELASQRSISQEEASDVQEQESPHAPLQTGLWDALNAFAREQAGPGSHHSSAMTSTVIPSVSTRSGSAFGVTFSKAAARVGSSDANGASELAQRQDNDVVASPTVTEQNTPSIKGTSFVPRQTRGQHPNLPPHLAAQAAQHTPLSTVPDDSPTQQAIRGAHTYNSPHGGPLSIHELQNIVKSYATRLDLLESLSYTHVPLDEVEEKFDHVDVRLNSLEEFRSNLETQLVSGSGQGRRDSAHQRRLLPSELTSFDSSSALSQRTDESSASAVSATAAVYAEYNSRFQSMSERIESLEKAVPTPVNPWHVEVVILPWGRHLPGIWTTSEDEPRPNDYRDEWTGMPNSDHVFDTATAEHSGWSTDSIKAWATSASVWLSGKACGPKGVVYHRLKSRGLVKDIVVESADAQNFMRLCKTAFADVLPHLPTSAQPRKGRPDYDALHEVFVPLRKLRKLSRLRFLAPSEMVSSALWTPAFLEASVFMKSKGHHGRLYVTFPEAYPQQGDEGWTWTMIRALPPVRGRTRRFSADHAEGHDIMQSCWLTNAKLDIPESASFTSSGVQNSREEVSRSLHPNNSGMSVVTSPVSEHRTPKDLRRRTISIPLVDVESTTTTPISKRRVASFEGAALETKRRKKSMSSQPPKPGPAHTPRLSREPPSPFTSDYPADSRSDDASGRRVVLTPLAYETPHSHTHNAVAALYSIDQDGDTDVETELLETPHAARRGEQEWRGISDSGHFTIPTQLRDTRDTEDMVIMRGSDGDESELDE